jgi:Zinc-finger of C2H2 type
LLTLFALVVAGELFTWGATHKPDLMGHEGLRWQPSKCPLAKFIHCPTGRLRLALFVLASLDPKRVASVCRAVGVAAAKEHTILLVGTTFPPIGASPLLSASLEDLAARKICEHVDLFNVIPLLITAERTHSRLLTQYCHEFIRRNLDGVLNVGQKAHLECYLNEHLQDSSSDSFYSRDDSQHPLLWDFALAGRRTPAGACLVPSSVGHGGNHSEWLRALETLANSFESTLLVDKYSSTGRAVASVRARARSRGDSLQGAAFKGNDGGGECSERCLSVTTCMDLSNRAVTEEKSALLLKELRAVRKRLVQIGKLERESRDSSLQPSVEQQEKISRKPQLEADLHVLKLAFGKVEKRLVELEPVKADTGAVGGPDETAPARIRCDVCAITCPDRDSLELHLSGRKHRNRVATLEEAEKKMAADKLMAERRQQMLSRAAAGDRAGRAIPDSIQPGNAWKMEVPSKRRTMWSLPPPVHAIPDSLVQTLSITACGRERAKKPSPTQSASEALPRPMNPQSLRLPHDAPLSLKSPPWASSNVVRVPVGAFPGPVARPETQTKRSTQPAPQCSPASLMSPPWGSVPATGPLIQSQGRCSISSSVASPGLPLSRWSNSRLSDSKSPAAGAETSESPGSRRSLSLGQFIRPTAQMSPSPAPPTSHATPKSTQPAPILGWGSASPSGGNATTSLAVRFEDIQKQEFEFKVRKDQSVQENSKWFVERRERAESLTEIQARETEHQRLVDEQHYIERQILNELAAHKSRDEQESLRRKSNRKSKRGPVAVDSTSRHSERKPVHTHGRRSGKNQQKDEPPSQVGG